MIVYRATINPINPIINAWLAEQTNQGVDGHLVLEKLFEAGFGLKEVVEMINNKNNKKRRS